MTTKAENTQSKGFLRVLEKAQAVFEGKEAALDWVNTPSAALGGKAPIACLDTDDGIEQVLDTLGRIEHGVFVNNPRLKSKALS